MDLREIGRRVAEARKNKRLTLANCKDVTGISISLISNLENGTLPEIGFSRLMVLAELLDLEIKLVDAEVFTLDEAAQRNNEEQFGHLNFR